MKRKKPLRIPGRETRPVEQTEGKLPVAVLKPRMLSASIGMEFSDNHFLPPPLIYADRLLSDQELEHDAEMRETLYNLRKEEAKR